MQDVLAAEFKAAPEIQAQLQGIAADLADRVASDPRHAQYVADQVYDQLAATCLSLDVATPAEWEADARSNAADREVVVVGWDGASQPMRRYRDELALPDHQREVVR